MSNQLCRAKELCSYAQILDRGKKHALARQHLSRAIALLEKQGPGSDELAEAYCAMCFATLFTRCRRDKRHAQQREAIAWYEKAIAVWERNGNQAKLGPNLSNLGSLYYRCGEMETALARNLRALELERQRTTLDDESVAAWNHVARCYLALGRLDEAESVVREGFARMGDNTPRSAYLWSTLAGIYSARAQAFHCKAKELAPPDSCAV